MKYDIKIYDSDGRENETIRNLDWVQVRSLELVFERLKIRIKIIAR